MPRKFDKYGWNRQFKWHPVSRRHPFPYHLPFVDDFSVAATVAASNRKNTNIPRRALGPAIHPHDLGSPDKDEYMKEVAEKRKRSQMMSRAHRRQKLFPHYPQHNRTRAEKVSDAAFMGAAALVTAGGVWLGAAAALEAEGGAGYMEQRMARFAAEHHLD